MDAITVASGSPKPQPKSPAGRQKPKLPKGCGHIKVHGTGIAVCAYITGFSDVTKLYGAALLQPKRPARPALINIDLGYRHVFKPGRLIEYSTGELYYQGHRELPPVRATFLAFRFVPVTATLHGHRTNADQHPIRFGRHAGCPFRSRSAPPRRSNPDLGRRCERRAAGDRATLPGRSDRTQLTLVGQGDNTIPPKGYTLPTGGPLTGRLTIPAFTNCGVTENLDPLLTGSISAPGNYVLHDPGKLCGPAQPQNWTCPPPVPKPIR